jgi:YaiO family outer membrane protein
VLLVTCLGSAAGAQTVQEQHQVPAAWVGPEPGGTAVSGFVDLRSFYYYVDGTGSPRPDWSGGELLSYFDVHPGLSGAFVLRHEDRGLEEAADFGTLTLIPRLAEDTYVVSSLGMGSGAHFLPVTRLDLQLRAFFPSLKKVMYDVGGYATWWTQERLQLAQSDAVILWYNPYIVELRYTSFFTRPLTGDWRYNFLATAILLYGAHREGWLLLRVQVGDEPENVPGRAFADTRDLVTFNVSVGYRHWITDDYGVMGELEAFHQVETWSRLGGTIAMFASF